MIVVCIDICVVVEEYSYRWGIVIIVLAAFYIPYKCREKTNRHQYAYADQDEQYTHDRIFLTGQSYRGCIHRQMIIVKAGNDCCQFIQKDEAGVPPGKR